MITTVLNACIVNALNSFLETFKENLAAETMAKIEDRLPNLEEVTGINERITNLDSQIDTRIETVREKVIDQVGPLVEAYLDSQDLDLRDMESSIRDINSNIEDLPNERDVEDMIERHLEQNLGNAIRDEIDNSSSVEELIDHRIKTIFTGSTLLRDAINEYLQTQEFTVTIKLK